MAGRPAVLARAVGAQSQPGETEVAAAAVVVAEGVAWGSPAAVVAEAVVVAGAGIPAVVAAVGSQPEQIGQSQTQPPGSPPWAWGSRRW